MPLEFNPYEVLQVSQNASDEIIMAAYKTLAKKYHPDTNKAPDAATMMQKINRAYQMLKDPSERKQVDSELKKKTSGNGGTYGSNSAYNSAPRSSNGGTNSSYRASRTDEPDYTYSSRNTADYARAAEDILRNATRQRPRPQPPYTTGANNYVGKDRVKERADGPALYTKRLIDDANHRSLIINVYRDKFLKSKVCTIQGTSRYADGTQGKGAVHLTTGQFDQLVTNFERSFAAFGGSTSPIDRDAGSTVFFRSRINGLDDSFFQLEVVKWSPGAKTAPSGVNNDLKYGVLIIGEKRIGGGVEVVFASQSENQMQTVLRIFKDTQEMMR